MTATGYRKQHRLIQRSYSVRGLLLVIMLLVAGSTSAQEAELFMDILPGPESSEPTFLGEINGHHLLLARRTSGWELSALSNGSLLPINGLNLESSGYGPHAIGIVGGRMVLAQYVKGSDVDQIIWSTDGESAIRVDTLEDGSDRSYPYFSDGAADDSVLYFAASTPETGAELWGTDGFTTWLVDDIESGPESSYPRWYHSVNGTVVFSAVTDETGRSLWKVDGASAGLIGEASLGLGEGLTDFLRPLFFSAMFDSVLYFAAGDSIHGRELWSTDGDSAAMVVDLIEGPEGSQPFFFAPTLGGINFTADHIAGEQTESAVFRFDGDSITKLFGTGVFPSGANPSVSYLTGWADTLLFFHQSEYPETDCEGVTLGRWDANSSATAVLSGMSFCPATDPGSVTPIDDKVYFRSYTKDTGPEVAIYDGSEVRILDVIPGQDGLAPVGFTKVDDDVYFTASTLEYGRELWVLHPSSIAIETPTQNAEVPSFSAYPNPARDRLHINLSVPPSHAVEIKLFDSLGRNVSVNAPSIGTNSISVEIDVAGLAAGVYWLRVPGFAQDLTRPIVVVN